MKIDIHGKGIEVTNAIKEHIEKNCNRLKKIRFVNDNDLIHVEIRTYEKEKTSRAKVTYHAKAIGKVFVGNAITSDLYKAIAEAVDKVLLQVKKAKENL